MCQIWPSFTRCALPASRPVRCTAPGPPRRQPPSWSSHWSCRSSQPRRWCRCGGAPAPRRRLRTPCRRPAPPSACGRGAGPRPPRSPRPQPSMRRRCSTSAAGSPAGSTGIPHSKRQPREDRMKLWYQSMSRQTEWGGYPGVLRGILDKVRDPDTEIHVAGITEVGGTGDQFRYLEYLETGEVLKNVHRAVREGFDAFLIGNIADPGLREAREIANIPVLGLCESALHVACMMGANFSLVTINEKFTPRIVENVMRYGLKDRLAAVNRMSVDRLLDLKEGFDDPVVRDRIVAQFNQAARANTDAGAEVVIAAGGGGVGRLGGNGIPAGGAGGA